MKPSIETYSTEKILGIIQRLQSEMKRTNSYSARFTQLSNDIAPFFAEMAKRTDGITPALRYAAIAEREIAFERDHC